MEGTKVTNGDPGFHSANAIQEIGGALKHLHMAAVANKDIVTNMAEAVEALTIKNASLTTKLSDAMKTNLEMSKNIHIKATQTQEYEEKRLTKKEREKASFESNLDNDGYCWTHGFIVTRRHSSQRARCHRQATKGRQDEKISWGEARQANETLGRGWKNLN